MGTKALSSWSHHGGVWGWAAPTSCPFPLKWTSWNSERRAGSPLSEISLKTSSSSEDLQSRACCSHRLGGGGGGVASGLTRHPPCPLLVMQMPNICEEQHSWKSQADDEADWTEAHETDADIQTPPHPHHHILCFISNLMLLFWKTTGFCPVTCQVAQ